MPAVARVLGFSSFFFMPNQSQSDIAPSEHPAITPMHPATTSNPKRVFNIRDITSVLKQFVRLARRAGQAGSNR
ncbi:MAG: hypothetical protein HBSAPP02_10840 [Phycisphaerae bacterium]|nr:MAG: hypothetical protein HBSAPP02_10840 [Phycisphaerae bacterium]